MNERVERIRQLKKEKDAVIMAHYYVDDEVQAIADYVGDSYYLSDMATKVKENTIVLCGVSFMGESARILNPNKKVLMPAPEADCPMAHMAAIERIKEVREKYDDVAVVCYVNSTAELKTHADVCVTSSNAMKIVKALPNQNIFFIPDEHLGRYIAEKLPEKNFIFNDGYCHVHAQVTAEDLKKAMQEHPNAKVMVHPECKKEVSDLADYAGSTAGIISYATASDAKEFIVCTEMGVLYELKKKNPDKQFYLAGPMLVCQDMKKITLDKIIHVLETDEGEVKMEEHFLEEAHAPLIRMLELSK